MKLSNPYKDHPPNWHIFNGSACIAPLSAFGLASTIGDVNRFAARYRVAKCYRGIILESFTQGTAEGYSALFRVLLTWSAFEFFLKAIGVSQRDFDASLAAHDTEGWMNHIRATDAGNNFYKFIYERVNSTHKGELENYFNADPANVTYLASAIRHLTAHGTLTPNADETDPNIVIEICNILSDALMFIMDNEFSTRMIEFHKMINS